MASIEKYIAKRINKDEGPDAIHANGDRMFLPGDLIDALNCRYGSKGLRGGKVRSIPGNLERTNTLASGTNLCVGTFLYRKYSTVVYCVWNDNSEHRVIEWNPDTNVFTTLLAGSFLNFNQNYYVCQGGIVDDIFIWNDRFNYIRSINIVKAKDGFYGTNADEILLAAIPPLKAPTFTFVDDDTLFTNYLIGNSFQFAYRYIYHDFRYSAVGPYSQLAFRPSLSTDFFLKKTNAIDVTVEFPTDLTDIIAGIEVLFRKGNTGNFSVFKKIDDPTASTYTVRFTNSSSGYTLDLDEQSRLYDDIPDRTDGLELMKNRLFVVRNKNGFDVDDSTFDFAVSLGSEVPTLVDGGDGNFNLAAKLYLKEGGKYSAAIVFQDRFGKTSFVKSHKTIEVPFIVHTTAENTPTAHYLSWELTGVPPEGFVRYQILLSQNKFQSHYFQAAAVIHMYVEERREGEESDIATASFYAINGKLFSIHDRDGGGNLLYRKLFLQIPLNVPFIPDNNCYVKFEEDFPIAHARVLEVIGDYLVIEDDFSIDWSEYQYVNIEVFKVLENVSNDTFYETGVSYPIIDGAFSQTTGRVDGDTYRIALDQRVKYVYSQIIGDDADVWIPIKFLLTKNGVVQRIESKSAIYTGTFIQSEVPLQIKDFNTGRTSIGTDTVLVNINSFDITKADANYGRIHTLLNNKEESSNLFSVVGWSSVYIQNSRVNGLSSFSARDHYNVPIELGKINSLRRCKNVLIASHDRESSSLYIEEGMMKQGDSFTLLRVTDVIGDDRQLNRGSGCINPESFFEKDGELYWWDAFRGEVARYTNAGIWPVSNYGMTDYFYQKSLEYYPYRDTVKIITGYDYSTDEFIIHFPAVDAIEAVTWSFDALNNRWLTRYSYHPEQIFSISKRMLTFKEGQVWEHNINPIHNNFYNQQYERSWRFACNPKLGSNKKFLNVHIDGEICAEDPDFIPVRVYTKEGQESYTPAYEFVLDEGKYCGPILRDVNTPGINHPQIPLLSGDEIVSNYCEVEIINDRQDEAPCGQVNVVFKEENFSK